MADEKEDEKRVEDMEKIDGFRGVHCVVGVFASGGEGRRAGRLFTNIRFLPEATVMQFPTAHGDGMPRRRFTMWMLLWSVKCAR